MSAGHIIGERRRAIGLTQKDVARRTGLTRETVSRVETGVHARRSTLRLLAVAVGLPASAVAERGAA